MDELGDNVDDSVEELESITSDNLDSFKLKALIDLNLEIYPS